MKPTVLGIGFALIVLFFLATIGDDKEGFNNTIFVGNGINRSPAD